LAEANLTAEVSLVALDTLSSYLVHFKDKLITNNGENDTMESAFSVLMTLLSKPQSKTVVGPIYAILQSFINNFSSILFKGI